MMAKLDRYAALLTDNPVVQFVSQKYGVTKSPRDLLLSDPYYRFFRIIDLLTARGILPTANDTWLDLGCHHGQFLAVFGSLRPGNFVGMDDWDLKATMPFTSFAYHKVNLADDRWVSHLPAQSVRFVSALEVIEHMTDTDKFLEAIKSISSAGAYLIISTPNINSLRNRVLVPFGVYPAFLEYRNVIHHVRLFNVDTLTTLLAAHGFAVRACIGVSFLPERLLRFTVPRSISETLGEMFPSLCGNLIVVAQRAG